MTRYESTDEPSGDDNAWEDADVETMTAADWAEILRREGWHLVRPPGGGLPVLLDADGQPAGWAPPVPAREDELEARAQKAGFTLIAPGTQWLLLLDPDADFMSCADLDEVEEVIEGNEPGDGSPVPGLVWPSSLVPPFWSRRSGPPDTRSDKKARPPDQQEHQGPSSNELHRSQCGYRPH